MATYIILIRDNSSLQLAQYGPILYIKQLNDTENKTLIEYEIQLNHTQFYAVEVSFDRNGYVISNDTRLQLSGEPYVKTPSASTNSEIEIISTGHTKLK